MEWNYITLRSVTFAQRGRKLLEGAGIPCQMLRTPRWMEDRGCGYALKLRKQDCERAIALLDRGEIPWRKVYEARP